MARLTEPHINLVFTLHNLEKSFDKQKEYCWSLLDINILNFNSLLSANTNMYNVMGDTFIGCKLYRIKMLKCFYLSDLLN